MTEKIIKISQKGEIVIPKELRDELGLRSGTDLIIKRENNHLIIDRAKDPMKIVEEFCSLGKKYGLNPQDFTPKKIKKLIDSEYEERYNSYMKGFKK